MFICNARPLIRRGSAFVFPAIVAVSVFAVSAANATAQTTHEFFQFN